MCGCHLAYQKYVFICCGKRKIRDLTNIKQFIPSEVYSEPCQSSVNYFSQRVILHVWQGSKYVSNHRNNSSFVTLIHLLIRLIHLSIMLSNQWICLTICVNQHSRVLLSYRKKVMINDKYHIYGHCVKSVQIGSFFWSIFSCTRTEYGDLRFSRSVNHGRVTDWGGLLTISHCKPIRGFTTIIIPWPNQCGNTLKNWHFLKKKPSLNSYMSKTRTNSESKL